MIDVSKAARPAAARTLHDAWWIFLVRGLLALAVGIVAAFEPAATVAALVLLLGVYFIADGIVSIFKAIGYARAHRSWLGLLLSGAIGIVAGIFVFTWPGLTALGLGYLVGIWAVVTGASELYVAVSLRRSGAKALLYLVFGIVSIAFGIFVAFAPTIGLVYLSIIVAIYGFVAGIALIAFAIRLRGRPAASAL